VRRQSRAEIAGVAGFNKNIGLELVFPGPEKYTTRGFPPWGRQDLEFFGLFQ
jgi:hypothetical protein